MASHYSYKIALLASVLLLSILPFYSPAQAAPSEFSVENVTVDAGGGNTTEARTKALAEGETEAFKQLLAKQIPAKAAAIAATTSTAQVSTMIRGYEVVDEKMTADHYHATMRYNFDPGRVKALLAQASAEPGATPAGGQPGGAAANTPAAAAEPAAPTDHVRKAVLVLPVYNEGGKLELWQDDNKWRTVWYEAALESGGGLVVAPLGDFDDRVDVDDATVENATTASLSRMLGRYGVGEIYVLSAIYNLKADPKPALEVTLKRLAQAKTETSHMSFTIHSTETLDTLMVRASNEIARSLYKLQTIDPNKIEYDRLKEIGARVNTSDIREWETLRKRLLTRGNIVGIRITSISFYETSMIISFKGTPDMLGKTLVASGLRVMQDGDSLVLALK